MPTLSWRAGAVALVLATFTAAAVGEGVSLARDIGDHAHL